MRVATFTATALLVAAAASCAVVVLAQAPGAFMTLTNWKLQLPVSNGDGGVVEVSMPALRTYSSEYFRAVNVTGAGGVVRQFARMSAPTNGARTSGSNYPRTELREMSGAAKANWPCLTTTKSLAFTAIIAEMPVQSPKVDIAQIHNNENGMVFLEYSAGVLQIKLNTKPNHIAKVAIVGVNQEFSVHLRLQAGKLSVDFNGAPKIRNLALPSTLNMCYLKAGAYVQSTESPVRNGTVLMRNLVFS